MTALYRTAPTLEQRRADWHTEQATLDSKGRTQCLDLYRAFPAFAALYPSSSSREFLTYWNWGEFNGKLYTWFNAGVALDAGFNAESLTRGDLSVIGQTLLEGYPKTDVQTVLTAGGIDAVRLMRGKKAVTTMQIPASEGAAIRSIVEAVSQSDNLPAPEAAARIIQAFGNTDPRVQSALLHQHDTGQNIWDAIIAAVDERKDYRAALKAQGCIVCGVKSGIELHHVRTEADDRYRTHARMVPLCTRHHIARPGDSTDSIHARPFADLVQDADFWRRAFVSVSDAAEASRPTQEEI